MPEIPGLVDLNSRSKVLKRVLVDPRDLVIDRQRLAAIVADLRCCGGVYTPRVNWVVFGWGRSPEEVDDGHPYLDMGFSDKAIAKYMSTMDKMLEAWIGGTRQPASPKVVSHYAPYLTAHDPLGLWTANVANADVLSGLLEADLGSIVDLNITHSFSAMAADRPNVILEIGGGYGRLAEAALNVFGKTIKYVLVDSVPGSLLYAREYLRRACPSAQIGFYYDGDPFDLSVFDCYIVPSWHFEAVNNTGYDICLNLESFQEMGQQQVDTYLTWFNDVAREGALIYLSNAHDYRFRGEWKYPVTWQRLLCTRIPRSWTPDHRAEVFIKSSRDYSSANAAIVAAYQGHQSDLAHSSRVQELMVLTAGALVKLRRSPKVNAEAVLRRVRNRVRTWSGRRHSAARR